MLRSQGKYQDEFKNVSPQKKITFYGPVVSTRGEKLRPVRSDAASRRQKQTFIPSSSLPLFSQTSLINRKSKHIYNKSKSSEGMRPHAKISVTGSQLKTRLNCNHARPKCQCPNIVTSKIKQSTLKHMPLTSDNRESSHILTSTCTIPRGGVNGRKIYAACDDDDEGLSVMDASWKPSQFMFKANDTERTRNRPKSPSHSQSQDAVNKQASADSPKKRVQFSDKTTSVLGEDTQEQTHRVVNHSHDPHRTEDTMPNHCEDRDENQQQPDMTDTNSSPVLPQRRYSHDVQNESESQDDYSERDVYDYDSTSSVSEICDRVKEVHQKTCKLCEIPRYRYPSKSRLRRMNSASDCGHPCAQKTDSKVFNVRPSRRSYEDDMCALCRRFKHRSYSLDDGDCYHCNSSAQDYCERDTIHCSRHTNIPRDYGTRNTLRKKPSAPIFVSDGEEEILHRPRIPYEPKTELVKDLKNKIEREYEDQDYLHHLLNHRRRLKSWDAEDLDELRQYRIHRAERHRSFDCGPPHKCVHHYLQNDRLYLEPTITDKNGRSLCAECGARQPADPDYKPYLYHVTLGGLKKTEAKNMENSDKENERRYYQQSEKAPHEASESKYHLGRTPGDTSKHVFAKLNRNIDNIFPSKSSLYLRPRAADELRYQGQLHSKRHPSKSMALVDHLL